MSARTCHSISEKPIAPRALLISSRNNALYFVLFCFFPITVYFLQDKLVYRVGYTILSPIPHLESNFLTLIENIWLCRRFLLFYQCIVVSYGNYKQAILIKFFMEILKSSIQIVICKESGIALSADRTISNVPGTSLSTFFKFLPFTIQLAHDMNKLPGCWCHFMKGICYNSNIPSDLRYYFLDHQMM